MGAGMGWLVSAQQQIFTDGPVQWHVPVRPLVVMLIVSILLSYGATYGPLRELLRRSPINILREAE